MVILSVYEVRSMCNEYIVHILCLTAALTYCILTQQYCKYIRDIARYEVSVCVCVVVLYIYIYICTYFVESSTHHSNQWPRDEMGREGRRGEKAGDAGKIPTTLTYTLQYSINAY